MKPKGLGELCAATPDLANQTGTEKKKKKNTHTHTHTNRSFDHPIAERDILSFKKKKQPQKIKKNNIKHINGPWNPEARNRIRPSFYACPGY